MADVDTVLDVRGKVVIVRAGATDDDTEHVANELHTQGAALVIFLDPDAPGIEALDEDEMRAAGWVRA